MRTRACWSLGVACAIAASACNSGGGTDAAADVAQDAGGDVVAPMDTGIDAGVDVGFDVAVDYLRPPDAPRAMTEAQLVPQRQSCTFTAGAWPGATLGSDVPVGSAIPIDHVIVIMMENRSFDSYFAQLPNYPGGPYTAAHSTTGGDGGADASTAPSSTEVEVPPAGWHMTDSTGHTLMPTHDTTQYCFADVNHEWDGSHREWNNGANDGFASVNDPNGQRSLYYYDWTDIPFYYGLASTFAIADHWHCSLLGPTNPNRFFSMGATAFGHTYNAPYTMDSAAHPVPQVFTELDAAGIDWKDYADGLRALALYTNYAVIRRQTAPHLASISGLMTDLQNGTLPPVAWVEPVYGGAGGSESDEHPPGTPMGGEAWVETIVRAAMASPLWAHTAIFITYDEHGGFADHVPPPATCAPDGTAPVNIDGTPATGAGFDRLGFRVPFTLVSPYARAHYVSHTVYDHASLLRFIEARFGLPALTARDANATPPIDMFDFVNPPAFLTPPTTLPHARGVDPATVTRCNAAFPSG